MTAEWPFSVIIFRLLCIHCTESLCCLYAVCTCVCAPAVEVDVDLQIYIDRQATDLTLKALMDHVYNPSGLSQYLLSTGASAQICSIDTRRSLHVCEY